MIYTITRTVKTLASGDASYLLSEESSEAEDGFDTTWTGAPEDWTGATTGTGAITNDTSNFQFGGHSVLLEEGVSGEAEIYQDFVVSAGDLVTYTVWLAAAFNVGDAIASVQNTDTGNYLTSAGTWQVAEASVFDIGSLPSLGIFAEQEIQFTVESDAPASTTLRVRYWVGAGASSTQFWVDTFSWSVSSIGMPRPVNAEQIEAVNLINNGVSPSQEWPLTKLTEQAWQGLAVKDLESTYPTAWYYNPTFSSGTLTLWPVPTGDDLQIAVYAWTQIGRFESLSDTFSLPPGYERAIVKNLAIELAPSYEKTPSPLLMRQASESLAAVKRSNRRASDLYFEAAALVGTHRPIYNIRTDM